MQALRKADGNRLTQKSRAKEDVGSWSGSNTPGIRLMLVLVQPAAAGWQGWGSCSHHVELEHLRSSLAHAAQYLLPPQPHMSLIPVPGGGGGGPPRQTGQLV